MHILSLLEAVLTLRAYCKSRPAGQARAKALKI